MVFLVTEWGDDVRPMTEDEAMVIVNHQATGDVCTLMMCLQDKGTVSTPLVALGLVLFCSDLIFKVCRTENIPDFNQATKLIIMFLSRLYER